MLKNTAESQENPSLSIGWIIPGALCAFFPLFVYWEDMAMFYYQGDEWTQMDQLDAFGYGPWLFSFFGENFMPFFKFIWSCLLYFGNGNYMVFLVFSFLVHALVIFFLGYLLRLWRFGLFAILFSQLILALNHTHIEIISQSIQLSNLLSYCFFLLLLIAFSGVIFRRKEMTWKYGLLISLLSLLGALSFSRGVLNGTSIFGASLLLFLVDNNRYMHLLRPALYAAVPCIAVGLITAIWSINYSPHVGVSNDFGQIGTHFFYQVSLNPWFQQIRGLKIGPGLAGMLLVLNLIAIAAGVFVAKNSQRPLFYILLIFFIGNATLMALGRNQQPIETIASWRYQYGVLMVFVPLVGVSLKRVIRLIPLSFLQPVVGIYVLWWTSTWVFDHWKNEAPIWSVQRGLEIRESANAEVIDPAAHTISKFQGITDERALQLTEKFNLH